jgi:hypothetical protein
MAKVTVTVAGTSRFPGSIGVDASAATASRAANG